MCQVKTFFLPLLISILGHLSFGQIQKPELDATNKTILEADNEVYFDETLQRLVAFPNARLQSRQVLLIADRIEYDRNQSEAFAQGKVILSDGEIRLLAKSLQINLMTGDFNASGIKFGLHPWAIQSEEISRQNSTIKILDSSLYFIEKEENEPNLKVRKIELNQEKENIQAEGISVQVGNRVVGRLPSFTAKTNGQFSKYNLRAGKQNNLGWYLGTGGKWELNPVMQANADITAYSKRGLLLSPGVEWNAKDIESSYSGSIESGWIDDQSDSRGNDLRGIAIDEYRSYSRAYSINRPSENWRVAGQFEWNEDSEVFRDFQRDRFSENQWNDSFGEISYEGKNWTLSSLTRWQANQYESTIEQMPNLRFDLAPTPLAKTKFYNTMAVEFSAFRKKGNFGELVNKSNKLDLSYQIIRPFRLPNGWVYSPHLAYRRQDYSLDGPNANRSWGELGNDLRYEVYGDYNWKNATWKIDQIRHIMGFSISHRKVNRLSANRESLIPQIDIPFAELNLRDIDLIDHIEADALKPYEVIRLGWEHEFLTKTEEQSRRIATFNFYQDLYHKKENEGNISKDFFANLTFNPAHWISLTGQSKIDTSQGKVIRNSFSAQFIDGTINNLEIGYFKYLSFSDQWRLSLNHRLDETKSFYGSIAFEEESNNIPYWQTAIEYNSSPVWTWIFSITGRQGTTKENETELAVSTRIFAF